MEDNLIYKIALTRLPRVGPRTARKLISLAGSPKAVFCKPLKELIPQSFRGKPILTIEGRDKALSLAEKELNFIRKNNIRTLFFLDPEYPFRLKQCEDAPIILFLNEEHPVNLDTERILSIVGTRNATPYGEDQTRKFIEGLAAKYPGLIIVSGLAYGIDVAAHRAALDAGLKTIAVLGHGLHFIYPAIHRKIADAIYKDGSLLTEFGITSTPDKRNFIQRNRIIAGLSDATIVVESGIEGGALITADIANSYNRDVYAFPGRAGDQWSTGCNRLIRNNQAALIASAADFEFMMGWDRQQSAPVQQKLFADLAPDEEKLLDLLRQNEEMSLDELSLLAEMPVSITSSIMINLEFTGLVKSLPGNRFRYMP